jgi:hypothetical protein
MTDQFAPPPAGVTFSASGNVPQDAPDSQAQPAQDRPPAQSPQQPTPPVAETHTTVTLDGVEHTIGEALTILGARNSLVQQIEAFVQQYGPEAAGWVHAIVDKVVRNLPPAS